jgi:hypothetical protein
MELHLSLRVAGVCEFSHWPQCDVANHRKLQLRLAYIKERQDQLPTPRVKTNSEKTGYKSRGSKPGRKTDVMSDPAIAAKRERALACLAAAE